MPGKWGYIGGSAALIAVGVIASRSDLVGRFRGEAEQPPVVALAPAAAPAAEPVAPPAADLDAEVTRLTAELAAREAENAELRTTLEVRDKVLASLQGDLATRDATIDALETRLAASDAELATLRRQIASLAAPAPLDGKLALFQDDPAEPSVARVATTGGPVALDVIFDAKVPGGFPSDEVSIHFDFASSRLTPGAQANAAATAVRISDMTIARVRLVGHADRVGSPGANRRLAARRAAAVADFLVASGVPRELILIDESGEADLPVATGPGVAEPLNRSVEINLVSL